MSLLSFNRHALMTSFLSISILLTGSVCGVTSFAQTVPAPAPAPSYEIDKQNRVITIHPIAGDATPTINKAVGYLITRYDKAAPWTVKFDGGKYMMKGHIYADKLENVSFVSDRTNPAILMKTPDYAHEYMFYSRYSKNISITGFQFYGKQKVFDPAMITNLKHPAWMDQGLYFASANGITIDKNRFHDFGNGALRITTSDSDPVTGVNSFNSTVTNNFFKNIFQVTTTSNTFNHGATANYLFQNNNIADLHGSIKFASRTAGATNVWVRNNTINGSTLDGFEISSYVNLEMSYNRILNIARHAVNCYTNDRVTAGFQWGDNITFKANVIDNAEGGLRFNANPYSDGYKPVPRNVKIEDNTISNLRGTAPAITLTGGLFDGISIANNKLNNIASKKYISVSTGSTNVTTAGNTVDSKAYVASN